MICISSDYYILPLSLKIVLSFLISFLMIEWAHDDCFWVLWNLSLPSQLLLPIQDRTSETRSSQSTQSTLSKSPAVYYYIKSMTLHIKNQEPWLILWPHLSTWSHTYVSIPLDCWLFSQVPLLFTIVQVKLFLPQMSFCAFSTDSMTIHYAKARDS
jgi:hypothetical protein